jgi:hypothetical protein
MIDKETYFNTIGTIQNLVVNKNNTTKNIKAHEISIAYNTDLTTISEAINKTIDRIKKDTNSDVYIVKPYIVNSNHQCFGIGNRENCWQSDSVIIIQFVTISKTNKENIENE